MANTASPAGRHNRKASSTARFLLCLPAGTQPQLSPWHPSNTLPWSVTHLNYFVAAVAGEKAVGDGLHGTPNTRAPGQNSHEARRGQPAAACSNPPWLERSSAASDPHVLQPISFVTSWVLPFPSRFCSALHWHWFLGFSGITQIKHNQKPSNQPNLSLQGGGERGLDKSKIPCCQRGREPQRSTELLTDEWERPNVHGQRCHSPVQV